MGAVFAIKRAHPCEMNGGLGALIDCVSSWITHTMYSNALMCPDGS